jgi:hypothetical protein
MAYEIPVFTFTLAAATDLSAKQYYYVKLNSSGKAAICAAATDVPIGILQNEPTAGVEAEVMSLGISKLSSDAALTIGNLVGTSSDGQGDAKTAGSDTTEYVCGQVLTASGAAAGLATVTVNCLAPFRAA